MYLLYVLLINVSESPLIHADPSLSENRRSEAFQTPYVLLSTREKVVCGVQKGGFTEATVICSELFPQVVWLASGGLTMLNPAITRQ